MRKYCRFTMLLLLCAAVVMPSFAIAAERAAPATRVAFVSGGVGEDDAARMAALGSEYNLKLLFAAKDGHYLADVAVTISDARGKVLETVSQGPFLFVRLAPGKYEIAATYAGQAQTRSTSIAASGRREVIFRWVEQQSD